MGIEPILLQAKHVLDRWTRALPLICPTAQLGKPVQSTTSCLIWTLIIDPLGKHHHSTHTSSSSRVPSGYPPEDFEPVMQGTVWNLDLLYTTSVLCSGWWPFFCSFSKKVYVFIAFWHYKILSFMKLFKHAQLCMLGSSWTWLLIVELKTCILIMNLLKSSHRPENCYLHNIFCFVVSLNFLLEPNIQWGLFDSYCCIPEAAAFWFGFVGWKRQLETYGVLVILTSFTNIQVEHGRGGQTSAAP